jgi:hypothetical protein
MKVLWVEHASQLNLNCRRMQSRIAVRRNFYEEARIYAESLCSHRILTSFVGFSVALRSQEIGLCLGAQAGEARIRNVVTQAGFSRFRRATETPFNIVYEARP